MEQNITKKRHLISNQNSDDLSKEKWILEPNFIRQKPWSGKGNPKNINLKITDKGILLSQKDSQQPLNPVDPVTRTLRPL